ncbi:Pentatricopeptide repeat-containing protein [Acorus gramineus]|uniref:Pentatricopeptide repeat-containing protein n=1 Tax=Acorus gramineus TaxID=55184 RepID=A0AAV9APS7_ACOGR|nr:Pentatricopeptide repeat-containing protein [Acorus gramineus]
MGSLQDLLKVIHGFSPETVRCFWRVSGLKPEDVLKILLGCSVFETKKVRFLWDVFRWASTQRDFVHLPESYKLMASMLVRARMRDEAEILFAIIEEQGNLSGADKIFSDIIEMQVEAREFEKSISLYDRMRNRGLVPTSSCYNGILNLLTRTAKNELVLRVYEDMIASGLGANAGRHVLAFVVKVLCKKGKIMDSVNLLKRVVSFGVEPSQIVLDVIVEGYCKKKDFEDALNFLHEWNYAPNARICNNIASILCKDVGSKEAWSFVQILADLGFKPDSITFNILLGWSCREGRLRDALFYLSELTRMGIKPNVCAYTSLISGVFKKKTWEYAKDVFRDMVENGIAPGISTFKVLLAGHLKYRRFDEVELIVGEMEKHGLISPCPLDDTLSKAFVFLGLDWLGVKVRRDNDVTFPRAEFFDNLGNGLYLETNLDEFEKILTGILDDGMIPHLESIMVEKCREGDLDNAILVKNELIQWGQILSLSGYSELLSCLCTSKSHVREAIDLFDEMEDLNEQLDHKTLSLLMQCVSKVGMSHKARVILDGMLNRELSVENETFTFLITSIGKETNNKELEEFWELAWKHNWLPHSKDLQFLVSSLCKLGMLKKSLELLEMMLNKCSCSISSICSVFVEEFSVTGFVTAGHILVEECIRRHIDLDHAAYRHLIKGLCKEKMFSEASRVLDIMVEKGIMPCLDVYHLLIPKLFCSGKMEKALCLKQIMLSKQPEASVSVCNALINEFCKIKRVREANFIVQEMLEAGATPDGCTLNAMLTGYCLENNLKKALGFWCIMLKKNFDLSISSYRRLVHLMCMQGQVSIAINLSKVLGRARELQYVILFNILIFHLFQSGNDMRVEALLDEMQEKKQFIPDQVSYDFLIYGYSKYGNASKSIFMLSAMMDRSLRPSNRSFKSVICYLLNNNDLDKALELSREMASHKLKHCSVVQTTIVEGLLSCGRLCEAELYLGYVEEECLIPDNINYDFLIKQFCGRGRVKKAVELLNIMLKRGSLPSESSYNSVIRGLCTCKDFDQALDFHSEMLQKHLVPGIGTYESLIYGLCLAGRIYEADNLLGTMRQNGPTPTNNIYRSIIDSYSIKNNLSRASKLLHEMQQNGCPPDFETHWSFISNLKNVGNKEGGSGGGFLSRLLSLSGFSTRNLKSSGAKPRR